MAKGHNSIAQVRRFRFAGMSREVREESHGHVVHRMTYRGAGGWSWAPWAGKLTDSIKTFVPKIGSEELHELT